MKKKIGDLTLREIFKHHQDEKDCMTCSYHLTPLCQIACIVKYAVLKCENKTNKKYLDQEIEVEEDE